ncbi:MAG TPA: D-alanyl-D-alanine carboxypeptidase [Clostridiales bacterium]|nr:D-alanyl-D-alanine carboxypeptidase [Clostridiales bacterium]
MKKINLRILPWIIIILIFAAINVNILNGKYEEILASTGKDISNISINKTIDNDSSINNINDYSTENDINKPQVPKVHALASLLMDGSVNRVLYEHNGYERMAMASTTKIMTCIIALENASLDEVVTISAYAARMPDVQLNVKSGEQYHLKDLLMSLMLESHNDVAVAIAEHVGGSVEGFATMMNDKARSLDCVDTNFITPNGLDAEGHYTTANDLAVIASYAIENDMFIKITNTLSHGFNEINGKRNFHVSNKNQFLHMIDGSIGVKTGFTNKAGYCFVGAIRRPDKTLISVVLGCGWPPSKSLKWKDTKALMNYGIDNYKQKDVFRRLEQDTLVVKDGQTRVEQLELTGDLSLLLRDDEVVEVNYDLPNYLQAPIEANNIVGYQEYYIDGNIYQKFPIYTTIDVEKIDFKFCFNKMFELWSIN